MSRSRSAGAGGGAQRRLDHRVTPEEAGQTVQQVLLGPMRLSRRMLQKLTRAHAVELNRRPAFLGRKLRTGDEIVVRLPPEQGTRPDTALAPVAMPLRIVLEDADLLVLDKPPYLLVHPTNPAQTHTLAHGVAAHLRASGSTAPVRPVHRLDRDTSGLVLFAKSGFAHQYLDRQLREGTLGRAYLALVAGVPSEPHGSIDAPIGRRRGDPVRREVRADGEPASTEFEVLERFKDAALLRLTLVTGRTHQIRVHLAHVGHPVLGDAQYGPERRSALIARQALHAEHLHFLHPRGDVPMTCEAPLPEDMAAALERLRAG